MSDMTTVIRRDEQYIVSYFHTVSNNIKTVPVSFVVREVYGITLEYPGSLRSFKATRLIAVLNKEKQLRIVAQAFFTAYLLLVGYPIYLSDR